MSDALTDCMTPLDNLLMNYAAGRLEDQERLLVNAARMLNPDVRSRLAQFEAMGARLMCEEAPAAVSAECLSHVMARIEKSGQPAVRCADKEPCPPAPDLNIPGIVHALISSVCAQQQWSRMGRGVMRMELQVRAPRPRTPPARTIVQKRLRLMKLAPQQRTPRHAHAGTEITLVLHGSFTDELGTFRKGDVVILTDPRFIHQPTAGDDGCICLTLTEARLRFYDPFARIMNTFWRI